MLHLLANVGLCELPGEAGRLLAPPFGKWVDVFLVCAEKTDQGVFTNGHARTTIFGAL